MTPEQIELKIKDILRKYVVNLYPYETEEKAVRELMKLVNKTK